MLGKRSAQRGLFEADTRYGEFVGQRTFYGYLASQRDELFRDEDFAALYSRHRGRPSVLATALVLQTYDGVSDEEAKQRADYDLRWKVALGLEVETRPYAKSTLQECRAQLILHDKTRAIFQRTLDTAQRRGVWKKGRPPHERQHIKLALDTTQILGRGAVKDTYNLLADGIVQVLRALANLASCELMELAEEVGWTRYVQGPSLKGQADVDWTDPKARQRFLAEIVTDAEQLLDLVRGTRASLDEHGPEDQELVAAAELLARILAQDVECDENGPRLKRGVAADRLISVHDPEMRHGRKSSSQRFNGHKAASRYRHRLAADHGGRSAARKRARCRTRTGGGRSYRSGNRVPCGGGHWRLRLRCWRDTGGVRGEWTDDHCQGARAIQRRVVCQDRVPDRCGGENVHLPERADHRGSATGERWRWHVCVRQ